MTKDQLLDKWATIGTLAAQFDLWMRPCYNEEIERGHDPDSALLTHRDGWNSTAHFQFRYGGPMYDDAFEFFLNLGYLGLYPATEDVIDLKFDLRGAFWNAWECYIDAYYLIRKAVENRPKVLADKMLSLLKIVVTDGVAKARFTEQALLDQSQEYFTLFRWLGCQNGHGDFLFDQAYYLLDYVAANGLENIEEGLPDADIYTSDLLKWLAGSTYNLNYVTAALEVCHHTDGRDLLQHAQHRAIGDVWLSLAQVLKDALK